MKTYKAKISATVEMIAEINEHENGDIEIVGIDEILENDDCENFGPIN